MLVPKLLYLHQHGGVGERGKGEKEGKEEEMSKREGERERK